MKLSRKQIEQFPAGIKLDELVDFYLNQSDSPERPFEQYVRPINSTFIFDGQKVIFNNAPPYSENERLAEHLAATHGISVEQLQSDSYSATFSISGITQTSSVTANTKALAVCRAALIQLFKL